MDEVELLELEDIFDIYGCEYLLRCDHDHSGLNEDERNLAEFRVEEIHEKYVHSVRERIKAELQFCGVELGKGFTIKSLVSKADKMLEEEIKKQSKKMMFGGGFNMMGVMFDAYKQTGGEIKGLDKKKLRDLGFNKKEDIKPEKKDTTIEENMEEGFFNNKKWKVISEAFIRLENANTIDDKIDSIDYLNDLQHNSFHLLIDLQTGRMLDDRSKGSRKGNHTEAVNVIKEVLDIKQGASRPIEFANKMTKEIGKIIRKVSQ